MRTIAALDQLAWAHHGPSKGARYLLMLHTFADESHDSDRADVLTLAGLLASQKTWNGIWERLGEVVDEEGVTFHATDCENEKSCILKTKYLKI